MAFYDSYLVNWMRGDTFWLIVICGVTLYMAWMEKQYAIAHHDGREILDRYRVISPYEPETAENDEFVLVQGNAWYDVLVDDELGFQIIAGRYTRQRFKCVEVTICDRDQRLRCRTEEKWESGHVTEMTGGMTVGRFDVDPSVVKRLPLYHNDHWRWTRAFDMEAVLGLSYVGNGVFLSGRRLRQLSRCSGYCYHGEVCYQIDAFGYENVSVLAHREGDVLTDGRASLQNESFVVPGFKNASQIVQGNLDAARGSARFARVVTGLVVFVHFLLSPLRDYRLSLMIVALQAVVAVVVHLMYFLGKYRFILVLPVAVLLDFAVMTTQRLITMQHF